MPNQYAVSEDGLVVIERWEGNISHQEILEEQKKLLQDPSILPGARYLIDARQGQFVEIQFEEIHQIPALHVQKENKTYVSRIALLVNSETWEKAKKLEKEAELLGITLICFNTLDVACTWLDLQLEEVLQVLEAMNSD